ncbi:MAG: hypothetical protein CTY19_17030 [Methylomonas sp.]|nr:MAG: hypothetical protein CTY19_17030 [Methylomonas sp.]
MKLLGKSFAVAAMALAVSTAAEARIQSIGDNTPDGSELIFNLWNATAEKSYTLDLGITTSQISNALQPMSHWTAIMNADSNFQAFLSSYSAGHNVTWGVFGGNQVLNEYTDLPNAGFYTTSVSNPPAMIHTSWGDIGNTFGKWDDMVKDVQTQDSVADNRSTFKAVGEQGYTGIYGNDFQTAVPFQTQGSVGEKLAFILVGLNEAAFIASEGANDPAEVFQKGSFQFNIVNGAASLGYAAPEVAPIPVPAAVWMFGTGLLGLLGMNRRKAA